MTVIDQRDVNHHRIGSVSPRERYDMHEEATAVTVLRIDEKEGRQNVEHPGF